MFNSPMSEDRARYLIEMLDLLPDQTVVDFGCGNGAFLRLLASEVSIEGFGIDNDDTLIERATSEWIQMDQNQSKLSFVAIDANEYMANMKPVDAILCIGSEYIFGGYANLLKRMKPLLKPNGKLLVGTIYWKQTPSTEYLSLMNNENPYHDMLTSVEMAYDTDYVPLDIGRANDDEWDRFESFTIRRYFKKEDEQDSAWQWLRGYLKWGMDTMGFCFLLFEKFN